MRKITKRSVSADDYYIAAAGDEICPVKLEDVGERGMFVVAEASAAEPSDEDVGESGSGKSLKD